MKSVFFYSLAACGLVFLILLYPWVPGSNSMAIQPFSEYSANTTSKIDALMLEDSSLDALVVADSNRMTLALGEVTEPINTHSIRKSIMSILIGLSDAEGKLNVDQSLAELGLDDAMSPLTDAEKQATIGDLMASRSGIYISAAGEHDDQITKRPARGSHAPGEVYFHNNWDFNALDSVLEAVGDTTETRFLELAEKLGFVDYQSGHFYYQESRASAHKQYTIFLSARDLAKVGQLVLRHGRTAGGEQLVSASWIELITRAQAKIQHYLYTDAALMWWIDQKSNLIWADGWGGQFMLIDMENDLVIVARNHTGRRLGELLWRSVLGHVEHGTQMNLMQVRAYLLADG